MGKNQQENAKILDLIRAEIVEKNICPDLAKQATNLVMGVGDENADILFIGEAPGKNEDLKGEPFVGAAGKFLDEMLAGIGMDRSQVYITNIVKYRPPNNRDPLPEEKKAFWPFLVRQIMVIKPKIIATLGRHSMEYFLPDRKITQIHGQPKRIYFRQSRLSGGHREDGVLGAGEKSTEAYQEYAEGASEPATKQKQSASKIDEVFGLAGKHDDLPVVILPLYHPAAALYNSNLKATLVEDFQGIPKIMKLIDNNK